MPPFSPTPVTLALGAWVLASAALFPLLGGRRAVLLVTIGGWALLPNADYPAEVLRIAAESSGLVHALAVPAGPWLNKATAVGLGCLVGLVVSGRAAARRVRPAWADAALLAWVAAPVASAAANGLPIADGLWRASYLAVAWGGPYLAGRVWFADPAGLRDFARAWVVAGLATLPFALAEFAAGPFWYTLIYGEHPYRLSGADRPLGHRPLVLLEHGNQFGVWAATVAVAAVGLWMAGASPLRGDRRWGVPGAAAALTLVGACVLWQSHGAVALMMLAIAALYSLRKISPIRPRRVALRAGGAAAVAVVAAVAAVAAAGGPGAARHAVRGLFHGLGKSSFTWRLARIEEHLSQVASRPVFGSGLADWSGRSADGTFLDPVALSLYFLAAGMFGLVGLIAVGYLLLAPMLRGMGTGRTDCGRDGRLLAAVLLGVSAADAVSNSVLLLPLLVAAGGLAGRPPAGAGGRT